MNKQTEGLNLKEMLKKEKESYEENKRLLQYYLKQKNPNTEELIKLCQTLDYIHGRMDMLIDILD